VHNQASVYLLQCHCICFCPRTFESYHILTCILYSTYPCILINTFSYPSKGQILKLRLWNELYENWIHRLHYKHPNICLLTKDLTLPYHVSDSLLLIATAVYQSLRKFTIPGSSPPPQQTQLCSFSSEEDVLVTLKILSIILCTSD